MRKIRKRQKLVIVVFLCVVVFLAVRLVLSLTAIAPTATRVFFHRAPALQQSNGRVNVLLLGIGGGSHDGPDLTDTIIYAGIDPNGKKVTLISIPRDLWVPDLQDKINTAYSDGEEGGKHHGLAMASATVSRIIGQPVNYVFRIDFTGFVKAIDEIGGIDVKVEHTLDDYHYPISGKEDDTCGLSDKEIQAFTATDSAEVDLQDKFSCRYKHLHFDLGMQHMDGETALEFSRSRHGIGSEGTDFARSRRQQLVIEAVRSKIFSLQTLINPSKVFALYDIIKGSIDTDIQQEEFALFISLLQKAQHAPIITAVLDFGDYSQGRYGVLENAPMDKAHNYAAALIPRLGDGNFTEIQQYVACVLTKGNCIVGKEPQLTPLPTN